MKGKICIVTGGNTGIGKATSMKLAQFGAIVVLACRSIEKANSTKAEIEAAVPGAQVDIIKLDLSDFESVKEFVKNFKEKYDHLDVLINNAGIVKSTFEKAVCGHESTFVTNHVGVHLLTVLLLDHLEKSPLTDSKDTINGPRIVNVASHAHTFSPALKIEHLTNVDENNFSGIAGSMEVYGRSKLCNILFTLHLNKIIKEHKSKIIVNSIHPGWVKTELGRERGEGVLTSVLNGLEAAVAKTPEDGAIPSLFAACDPSINGISGEYYDGINSKGTLKDYAKDEEMAQKLWEFTESIINHKLERWNTLPETVMEDL